MLDHSGKTWDDERYEDVPKMNPSYDCHSGMGCCSGLPFRNLKEPRPLRKTIHGLELDWKIVKKDEDEFTLSQWHARSAFWCWWLFTSHTGDSGIFFKTCQFEKAMSADRMAWRRHGIRAPQADPKRKPAARAQPGRARKDLRRYISTLSQIWK